MEKEPSILEKGKEDQSKYFLSYSKPSFLNMKWEYRDINVVERAKIPKFSKLDDKLTFLRILELFFIYVLVDMTADCTKLYSHRETAFISFEITNEKIHLFLSMLLLKS